MNTGIFLLGVLVALLSGIFNNLGTLFQKKAVNDYLQAQIGYIRENVGNVSILKLSNVELDLKSVCWNRTWIFGLALQVVFGTGFFLVGQGLIGPSLTPALGSFGLIVIVFASCMLQEKLTREEYVGIVLMVGAVVMLAFSGLTIDQSKVDFLETSFIIRATIYTAAIAGMNVFCKLWSYRKDKWEGTVLATHSGLFIALSNFWIAPLINLGSKLVTNHHSGLTFNHPVWAVWIYTLVAAAIVVFANVWGVYERQLAFRVGHAATMIPISHVPSHLSSPIIYSFVFWLRQPQSYSLALMWIGMLLLLGCSFIFGKREAMLEKRPQVEVTHIEELNRLV